MQFSAFVVSALATVIAAAPGTPALQDLHNRAPSCDVSTLSPPAAPTPLPAPPAGSKVILVAIGKGTQNYTCADSNPTTVPTQVGALADLYNASCLAAANQNMLNAVTQWAEKIPAKYLDGLPKVGEHYFVTTTTPTFVINNVGTTECKKNATSSAPANSDGDVAWLYLTPAPTGSTDDIKAVYRVETQSGSPPATCSGKAAGPFEVPYAAQYWFYA